MQTLNLPEYNVRLNNNHSEIFCLSRKMFVALTPEEWVRQHFINFLITYFSYPKGMIRVEYTLKYLEVLKRTDMVIFSQDGKSFMVVECKSYKIKLGTKTVSQLAQYNKILNAKYLFITNGMQHFGWKKTGKNYKIINFLPHYEK